MPNRVRESIPWLVPLQKRYYLPAVRSTSANSRRGTNSTPSTPKLPANDARRRKSEIARSEANKDTEWQAIYEDEIAALQDKIKEIEEERDEMMDLVAQSDTERDHYITENQNFAGRLNHSVQGWLKKQGKIRIIL